MKPSLCGREPMPQSSSTKEGARSAPPPPALKVQPRVPVALQAVFLESSRQGTAHNPPKQGLANKTFGMWLRFSGLNRNITATKNCATDEKEVHLKRQGLRQRSRRRLVFGRAQTFLYEESSPTQHCKSIEDPIPCRWASQAPMKTRDMPTSPHRQERGS